MLSLQSSLSKKTLHWFKTCFWRKTKWYHHNILSQYAQTQNHNMFWKGTVCGIAEAPSDHLYTVFQCTHRQMDVEARACNFALCFVRKHEISVVARDWCINCANNHLKKLNCSYSSAPLVMFIVSHSDAFECIKKWNCSHCPALHCLVFSGSHLNALGVIHIDPLS